MEILKAKYKKINNIQSGGLLSRADIISLKDVRDKPMSPHRKRTYKKWICTGCKHEFFYMVRSCLLCESANINEITLRTQYQFAFISDEIAINADNVLFDESTDKMLELTTAFGE
jgi:hypothetical protein